MKIVILLKKKTPKSDALYIIDNIERDSCSNEYDENIKSIKVVE